MASLNPAQLQTPIVRSLRLAAVLFVVFILSTSAAAQRELPREDVGLDIVFPGSPYPAIRMALNGGHIATFIRREQLMIIDANSAGDLTGVRLSAEYGGDAIRIKLSILYGDLSWPNREQSTNRREEAAGSYLLHEGESVRPVELTQLGIEPFELKLVVAKTRVLNPGEEFPIVNNTTALAVERLEAHLDGYRLWLKNISTKNVVAYNIANGRRGISSDGRGDGPVLAAGASSHELRLGSVDERGITISVAVFDDGTFEGDAKQAAPILAKAEGMRIQAPHVLLKIDQTLAVNDSELAAAFDKGEAELWVIPEAIDKASAIELLKARFPSLDEKTWSALYEDLKGGLYDARNIALTDMGVNRRNVRERQQRIEDDGYAAKALRETLEHVKQTLERIVSGKL